jgi:hypothetical protein
VAWLTNRTTVVLATTAGNKTAARAVIDDRNHARETVAKPTGGSRNGAASFGLFVQAAAASRWNQLPFGFVRLAEDPG